MKVFRYGIFFFHCDKKLMLLKTTSIVDSSSYKVGDSVMIKLKEEEDSLKADIVDLHGKCIS